MALLVVGEGTQKYPGAIAQLDTAILGTTLDVRQWPDCGALDDIRYVLAWQPPPGLLADLPNLELIISSGAGIDHLLSDPDLPQIPLVRFVDPDLTKRMCDYVMLHTLFHHRRMCEFGEAQRRAQWVHLPEPDASQLRVGIMGLGELGCAAASALSQIGYRLNGWSRTAKSITGVATFAGFDGLAPFLAQTDILVCLLPLTANTRGILNKKLLNGLAQDGPLPGPALINAGRGALQIEADILKALNGGVLYAASLDVFEYEPLPVSSPFWSHPRVVVTPHSAAESTANATAHYTLRQIKAHMRGEPLANLVDIARGY